jgi:hypothetical protein
MDLLFVRNKLNDIHATSESVRDGVHHARKATKHMTNYGKCTAALQFTMVILLAAIFIALVVGMRK